jgi:hypothetical protein
MWRTAVIAAFMFASSSGLADAGPFASTAVARQLMYSLERHGLTALAAPDPAEPGAFVAVLRAGRDLFLVRARVPDASKLAAAIHAGRYQQVFFAMRASSTQAGKLFVFDQSGDGLLSSAPGNPSDTVREEDRPTLRLDGNPEGQGLGAAEYDRKIAAADARYAEMLRLLTPVLS